MYYTLFFLFYLHRELMSCIFFLFVFQVKSLVFDQSGTYLAVAGTDIRVYICKQWSEVLNFTGEGWRSSYLIKIFSCFLFLKWLFSLRKEYIIYVFVFTNRPHWTGDWGGLWRTCQVPDIRRNGQKSPILQFVEDLRCQLRGGWWWCDLRVWADSVLEIVIFRNKATFF